jgi:hypothetical protein
MVAGTSVYWITVRARLVGRAERRDPGAIDSTAECSTTGLLRPVVK